MIYIIKRFLSSCIVCSSGPLATTTTAATGSFINSQCETNHKHWSSGPLSYLIRSSIYKTFPGLKPILPTGFFAKHTVHLRGTSRTKKMVIYKVQLHLHFNFFIQKKLAMWKWPGVAEYHRHIKIQ